MLKSHNLSGTSTPTLDPKTIDTYGPDPSVSPHLSSQISVLRKVVDVFRVFDR